MMIGPVSNGDDMHSETVRLGRNSESNEDSWAMLWKARRMVVLAIEVAEGWTTQHSFGHRCLVPDSVENSCQQLIHATFTPSLSPAAKPGNLKEGRPSLVVPLFQALSY
jgi:hypothetical protein